MSSRSTRRDVASVGLIRRVLGDAWSQIKGSPDPEAWRSRSSQAQFLVVHSHGPGPGARLLLLHYPTGDGNPTGAQGRNSMQMHAD